MKKMAYTMTEKVWLYPGEAANWHFVTLTKKVGAEIKQVHGKNARGFGSLPVEVKIGKTVWNTSIFPDKFSGSYLLPLKAKVRFAEGLVAGEAVTFTVTLR